MPEISVLPFRIVYSSNRFINQNMRHARNQDDTIHSQQQILRVYEGQIAEFELENLRLEKRCHIQRTAIGCLAILIIGLLIYTLGVQ